MSRIDESRPFLPVNIAVLTVSDSRGPEDDSSGDLLVQRLSQAGHRLVERALLPDDRYRIRALVADWIARREIEVVLTTGGTGLTGRDGTPEAVLPLLDKRIDGFGELFRALSYEEIGTATIASRVFAGVANGTIVCCLPGSTNACRTAWDRILVEQLDSRHKPCNLAQLLPRLTE
jgi:molybdenum cofactor biosynthesis protein B